MIIRGILATIASLFILFSYVPQIIHGYKRKTLGDLSIMYLGSIATGLSAWVAYGIFINDLIFTVANIAMLSFSLILISMKIYYGRN
ncbi:MAG: SemiSWEET family sugar transporter [archaeon]